MVDFLLAVLRDLIAGLIATVLIFLGRRFILPRLGGPRNWVLNYYASRSRQDMGNRIRQQERELARLEFVSAHPESQILDSILVSLLLIWLMIASVVLMNPLAYPYLVLLLKITNPNDLSGIGFAVLLFTVLMILIVITATLGFPEYTTRKDLLRESIARNKALLERMTPQQL